MRSGRSAATPPLAWSRGKPGAPDVASASRCARPMRSTCPTKRRNGDDRGCPQWTVDPYRAGTAVRHRRRRPGAERGRLVAVPLLHQQPGRGRLVRRRRYPRLRPGCPARLRRRPYRRDRRHHPADAAAGTPPGRRRLLLRDGPLRRRPRAVAGGRVRRAGRRRGARGLAAAYRRPGRRPGRGVVPDPGRGAQRGRPGRDGAAVAQVGPGRGGPGGDRPGTGQPWPDEPDARRQGVRADPLQLAHVRRRAALRAGPGDRQRGDPAVVAGVHRDPRRAAGLGGTHAAGAVRRWNVHIGHRRLAADEPGILVGVPASGAAALLQPGHHRDDGTGRAVRRLGLRRRPAGAADRHRRTHGRVRRQRRPVRAARLRHRRRVRPRLGRRRAVLATGPAREAVRGMRTVHPIEARSYRLLREAVDTSGLPPRTRDVVERIVHTTADPAWLPDLVADETALENGARALAAGAPLVVDVAVVGAGTGPTAREGATQFRQFGKRVAGGVEVPVAGGFIELSPPPLAEAVTELVHGGARRLAAVPLMLVAAGHAKGDIPAALARERARHPGLCTVYGRPLGPHPTVLALLRQRLAEAGAGPDSTVLLVGRGSTDPDANAEVAKVARLLAETTDVAGVEYAFVSLAPPDTAAGLERCRRLGARDLVVLPYFLFTGVLPRRVAEQARRFGAAQTLRGRLAAWEFLADPRRAGRDAARQACVGTDAALVIVFCSGQADPAEVLVGIDEIFPGVPLIGCSAQAVIASAGLDGPGVAVTVLGGPGFSVRTGLASAAGGAQREAGAAVGGCLGDLTSDAPHRILMLLTDGALGDQEEILAGAYSVVGASVPLIGGTCGPDPALGHGYQLHGREVATRSVVGAVIASDAPFAVGLRH